MLKRKNEVKIRLTDEELESLNLKAKKSGLSREEFIRHSISNKRVHELPPVDYTQLIYEMRRVGQTLNRIFRIAALNHFFEAKDLRECLEKLRALEVKIHNAFFASKDEN